VLHERRSRLVESQVMMTTVTSMVTEPPAAPRAGADLRAARERLGLSLDDVAATLRIRPPHLKALEEGRITLLPGNAYALAFVRTYAGALGLDPEEIVRRFKAEAAEFGQRPRLVFPVPMPERGLPAGALVLLGLVLAVGAYTGWYRLSGEGRLPAETVTAVPERLAPLAEQALPRPQATTPVVAPQVALSEPAPSADPTPPAMTFSPTSAAAAQLPPRPTTEAQAAGLTQPAPDTPRILLRANADSWLLVKDRAGAVLLNRVLKAGETWPVPPKSALLMTTGNAGGTEIVVDGATTPALGGNGAVRRDLPLDPDQIKDGKLAAAAVPPVASARPRQ
jgi:cytoskeleton protein RodZ